MTTLSYSLPQTGASDATEEPKIASALAAILTWGAGNIDASNIAPAYTQAAGVNVGGGATVKGVSFNAGPGTRTNTAYGALGDAADQVTGITLATNGLLRVWFQGTWQESVQATSRAAIFVGANQLKVSSGVSAALEAAATQAAGGGGFNASLFTFPGGLASFNNGGASYGGDATTGQAVGGYIGAPIVTEVAGSVGNINSGTSGNSAFGGPVDIFAAAGTYTISVQYKSSSGTVTASNRRLWCQAISFA